MNTQERLIDAAMRLFWEKGYLSTSIADILHAAGANSGSLYYFFPTKQDLLIAVLDRYIAGIHPMLLAPAWEGIDDPIERVFALLDRYRQMLVDTECFYGCPIGSIALELHEPDPAVREKLATNFDGWVDAIHQCLTHAGDRLPRTIDRRSLAIFALTTMEGGVMLSRTHRNLAPYDAAVAMLRDYFDRLEVPRASRAAKRVSPAGPRKRRTR
jgi:TetR/AcrR family transcriptional repressor of nem operon